MTALKDFCLGIGQFPCVVGDLQTNIDRLEATIDQAIPKEIDVLVTPELSLTGYGVGPDHHHCSIRLDEESPELRRIEKLSSRMGLAVGFVEETHDSLFYNSVGFWYRGELLGLHRKVYPPTYGRFDEGKWFARGNEVRAFDTPWGRFAMLICADAWHPGLPYLAAHDGADVMLYMAASAECGLSDEIDSLESWHRMNRSHALTHSAYVVFSNHCGMENQTPFTGGSQVIDPRGEILCQQQNSPGVQAASIQADLLRKQRTVMPFRRDDDLELTARLADAVAKRKKQRGSIEHATRKRREEVRAAARDQAIPIVGRIGFDDDADQDAVMPS